MKPWAGRAPGSSTRPSSSRPSAPSDARPAPCSRTSRPTAAAPEVDRPRQLRDRQADGAHPRLGRERHDRFERTLRGMPRGYEEGPVAEEAERRRDDAERGVGPESARSRVACGLRQHRGQPGAALPRLAGRGRSGRALRLGRGVGAHRRPDARRRRLTRTSERVERSSGTAASAPPRSRGPRPCRRGGGRAEVTARERAVFMAENLGSRV